MLRERMKKRRRQKKKPLNKLFYHGTKHHLPLLEDEVHFVMEFSCFRFVVVVRNEIFCGVFSFQLPNAHRPNGNSFHTRVHNMPFKPNEKTNEMFTIFAQFYGFMKLNLVMNLRWPKRKMNAGKHQTQTQKIKSHTLLFFVVNVFAVENSEVNLISKRNKRKIFRMNNLLKNIIHVFIPQFIVPGSQRKRYGYSDPCYTIKPKLFQNLK